MTILVKLHQFDPDDRKQIQIDSCSARKQAQTCANLGQISAFAECDRAGNLIPDREICIIGAGLYGRARMTAPSGDGPDVTLLDARDHPNGRMPALPDRPGLGSFPRPSIGFGPQEQGWQVDKKHRSNQAAEHKITVHLSILQIPFRFGYLR